MLQPFSLACKVLIPGAKALKKGRKGDAAYDLWATHIREDEGQPKPFDKVFLQPGEAAAFYTGIAVAFTEGWGALICDRSGYGFKGLMKQAGLLDPTFRGQWCIKLLNTSRESIMIQSVLAIPDAKAMCQVIFVPCGDAEPEIVEELPESVRGAAGFGSSDKP
jgi:dUTP pyrophosphatase